MGEAACSLAVPAEISVPLFFPLVLARRVLWSTRTRPGSKPRQEPQAPTSESSACCHSSCYWTAGLGPAVQGRCRLLRQPKGFGLARPPLPGREKPLSEPRTWAGPAVRAVPAGQLLLL